MDSAVFEEWLHEICPLLRAEADKQEKERAILIMDNASYHTHYLKKVIRKLRNIDWIP